MQYPDEAPGCEYDRENFYGWLMEFGDGNRMDLHVEHGSRQRRLCGQAENSSG